VIRTGSKVIADKVVFCDSVFSKAAGLRFKRLSEGEAYVFRFSRPVRMSMDMFFVFESIDVVFLDEDGRVVEIKEGFRPFTFFHSKNKALFVVELRCREVSRLGIMVGDVLEIDQVVD